MLKLKEQSRFEDPQAAAYELIRIAKTQIRSDWPYAYTGATNFDFLYKSGGTLAEYTAGRDFAIANSWLEIDKSGGRITLLNAP